jgi:D-alanyl-D-alanine carboxypeptidase
VLAALTLPTACGGAPVPDPPAEGVATPLRSDSGLQGEITGILEAHHADGEFVGAALALRTRDGSTVMATSGTRSVAPESAEVDPSVAWNIGSVTKMFVAVVVLQLAEADALDLDSGIHQYLPELSGSERITPRQLLQHTSGLGEYLDQPAVLTDTRREWTPDELIAVAEAAGRTGEPGGPHAYSNTNYIVLGEIIEQVTGNSWDDEVRERIAEPLGLQDTRLTVVRGTPGYGVEDGAFVDYTDRYHLSLGGAAGALESTAADLLAFAEALRDGRLLSEESQVAMATFVPAEDLSQFGVDHRYGLGLEEYANDQLIVQGHLGNGAAHSAYVGFDREGGAAVAVLTNTATPGPQAVIALEALAAVTE